jgi:uncharacterized NAD(P)/FAD-binding protein YdhS
MSIPRAAVADGGDDAVGVDGGPLGDVDALGELNDGKVPLATIIPDVQHLAATVEEALPG